MAKTSNIRTVDFLPEIFKTKVNSQFLSATLDTLTTKPEVTKISGYIGKKYGYGVSSTDIYVDEISTERSNYQLEPSVVQLNQITGKPQDVITYNEILSSLRNNNVNTDNPNRLFDSEYYAWDSFIDLDKLVNYGQYYWLESGVDSVTTSDAISSIVNNVTYTTTEGFVLSNGAKLKIGNESYWVEGVGNSIKLIPSSDLFVVEKCASDEYIPYESTAYDASFYDSMILVAKTPDYLTINRAAINKNAWSRYNRWVHIDVIKATAKFNGTSEVIDSTKKALRPIIEFRPDLSLFRSAKFGKHFVDFFDTTVTDVSTVNANHRPDGQSNRMFNGATVIFSESNHGDKIYQVVMTDTTFQLNELSECVDDSMYPIYRGDYYSGKSLIFKNQQWTVAQQKTSINQSPIFDVFDSNGISFSDASHYPLTSFVGSTLFSYGTSSSSTIDPILGLPIRYTGAAVMGDLVFTSTFNSDMFEYRINTQNTKISINSGYVHEWHGNDIKLRNGWSKSTIIPAQFQIFENVNVNENYTYKCDISPSLTGRKTRVYHDNVLLQESQYSITTTTTDSEIVLLDSELDTKLPVTIMMDSNQKSRVAYYELPVQLQFNPTNGTIGDMNIGEIRLHYQSIFKNTPLISGNPYGANTYRDMGYIEANGEKIIRNSCSFPLMAIMLKDTSSLTNNSLMFSSDMYGKFKDILIRFTEQTEFSVYDSSAKILDSVMNQYILAYGVGAEFSLSDMLPCLTPTIQKSHSITTQTTLTTVNTYDFDSSNQSAVIIYRVSSNGVEQMIKGLDYTIDHSTVTLLKTENGNTITINEYNSTIGNYVPSTPTKLGLYPSYIPELFYDDSYVEPTWFIKGHDGSLTKTYGQVIDGKPSDFRDKMLLEFELRVFNNLKVKTPLIQASDIVPGFFRKTDYSLTDIRNTCNIDFMNWVGKNRIDFKSQYYVQSEPKTHNYKISTNKLDGTQMVSGNWRGIFIQFYDTATPHLTPWEMIGLTIKPLWWDQRYGVAPYLSTNTVLWDDMEAGRVWNDGSPYIDPKYARTGLSAIIPVDPSGNLKAVGHVLIANYDSMTRNRDWEYGDMSPSEYAYTKSSEYPFDVVKMIAHLKPLKFFTYFADTNGFGLNDATGQMTYGTSPFKTSDIILNDSINRNGYLTYLSDYNASMGKGHSSDVNSLTQNLDTRLTYKLAGFIDNDTINFATNSITATSSNNSLVIPRESYSILLHANEPAEKIKYSSIIIQKTVRGYKIYGNSQNSAYFNYYKPNLSGDHEMIPYGSTYVRLSKSYETKTSIMPYGTELLTLSQVTDFLVGYGKVQSDSGMTFNIVENGIELNWRHIVDEFLYWVSTGWSSGSVINLNPSYNKIEVNKDNSIVQPLTLNDNNFILDQNSIPVNLSDIYVYRDGTQFTTTSIKDGTAFAYFNANLSNIEHVVVFDNTSIFGDTLYSPLTGMRQIRIKVNGVKTDNWNGTITTGGFILNQDNVKQWQPNKKYTKGIIVLYKNSYWISNQIVAQEKQFDETKWTKTDYSAIQKGLLPNPNTKSYESELYYSPYKETLTPDMNQLGRSLIGYRPRAYFEGTTISDISQFNFLRSAGRRKGTNSVVGGLANTTINGENIDYKIYENWALKTEDFGGVLNSNYIDIKLQDELSDHNPCVIQLTGSGDLKTADMHVDIRKLQGYLRPPKSQNLLPTTTTSTLKVPYAGYVNINDVKTYAYDFDTLKNGSTPTSLIYKGDYIWVSDIDGSWQIYTPVTNNSDLKSDTSPVLVTKILNNLNGTIDLTTSISHGLVENDKVMVTLFNSIVDGYYIIDKIVDQFTVQVKLELASTITSLNGSGIIAKFKSRRIESIDDLSSMDLSDALFAKTKVWVDSNDDLRWETLQKSSILTKYLDMTYSDDFTQIVPFTKNLIFVANSAQSKITLYAYSTFTNSYKIRQTINGPSGYGKALAITKNFFAIASDKNVTVYNTNVATVYSFTIDNSLIIESIDVTPSGNYVACLCSNGQTLLYKQNGSNADLVASFMHSDGGAYGSIKINSDASTFIISSPLNGINSQNSESGSVTIYDRFSVSQESVYGSSSALTYVLPFSAPNFVSCYRNGMDVTAQSSMNGNTLTLNGMTTIGDVIKVESNIVRKVQKLLSDDISTMTYSGRRFGNSVAPINDACHLFIGAPYEVKMLNSIRYEGVVHHYLDDAKIKGETLVTLASNVGSCELYVNGFKVVANLQTIDSFVSSINSSDVQNIYAVKIDNITAKIAVKNMQLAHSFNALSLTFLTDTESNKIILNRYSQVEVLTNPYFGGHVGFGKSIKSDGTSLIINNSESSAIFHTTFDFSDNENIADDTIFDNNFTGWTDTPYGQGSTILYKLISDKLVLTQLLSTDSSGKKEIGVGNGCVIIASDNGELISFESSGEGWSTYDIQNDQVDINRIGSLCIYDTVNSGESLYLDTIDPLNGKFHGTVASNLDFISSYDPAGYTTNNSAINWQSDYVGSLWFDTSKTRFMEYRHNSAEYNYSVWANPIPGSTVNVYTWVESDSPPSNYIEGIPKNTTEYSLTYSLNADNSLKERYYFWAKTGKIINPSKTLPDTVIQSYIADPLNSGLYYFAGLSSDQFALFNVSNYLSSNKSFRLGYSDGKSNNQIQTENQLIRDGIVSDFLGGMPKNTTDLPTGLYRKFIDSFVSVTENGTILPDSNIPELNRYGVLDYPMQTMFKNNQNALFNYLSYFNTILKSIPYFEMGQSILLFKTGVGYDVTDYWEYADWIKEGYDESMMAFAYPVDYYYELQSVTATEGMYVRVNNTGSDYEVYVYSGGEWVRVLKHNVTLQFKSSIYDYTNNFIGYDNQIYDSMPYDSVPVNEIRYIIRAINEEICESIPEYRNSGLILMFNYIMSEHTTVPDWLVKTSLIDVEQSVRELVESPTYQIDNTDLISGYVQDVKPYHVVIKDFSYKYNLTDNLYIGTTDFDLPSEYLSQNGKYVTPQLIYSNQPNGNDSQFLDTDAIWNNKEYKNWYAYKGMSLTDELITITVRLNDYVTSSDTVIQVDNASGIPEYGSLSLNGESMDYQVIDRINGYLKVDRGFDLSLMKDHVRMSLVTITTTQIIVTNSGNGYDSSSTATLNYSGPSPKVTAELKVNTLNGKITSITVVKTGIGYMSTPTVTITGGNGMATALVRTVNGKTRSMEEEVRVDRLSYTPSLRTWTPSEFYTGRFMRDGSNNGLSSSSSKLYSSYSYNSLSAVGGNGSGAKFNVVVPLYEYPEYNGNGTITTTVGSATVNGIGTNFTSLYAGYSIWSRDGQQIGTIADIISDTQLILSADASIIITSEHFVYALGELKVNLEVNGNGYQIGDTLTISGSAIGGNIDNNITVTVVSVGSYGDIFDFTFDGVSPVEFLSYAAWASSSDKKAKLLPIKAITQNTTGTELTIDYSGSDLVPSDIKYALVTISDRYSLYRNVVGSPKYPFTTGVNALFNVGTATYYDNAVLAQYSVDVVNGGSGYELNDVLIVKGDQLGGTNILNDLEIIVTSVSNTNQIISVTVNGLSPIKLNQYYAYPLTASKIGIFNNIQCTDRISTTEIDINQLVYVAKDTPRIQDIVYYGGNAFECLTSNYDAVFDFNKWKKMSITDYRISAADRIKLAYGTDNTSSYMDGVLYNGNTLNDAAYTGATLDQTIQTTFETVTENSIIDHDYQYGYGPDELVAAKVSDELIIMVSADGFNLNSSEMRNPVMAFDESLNDMEFRILIDQYGDQHVHRILPVNIDTLVQSVDAEGETFKVNNVLNLLNLESFESVVLNDGTTKYVKIEDFVAPFIGDIKYVKLTNVNTSSPILDFEIREHNSDYIIVINDTIYVNDVVDVELYSGSEVLIGNERMSIVTVDKILNTLIVNRGNYLTGQMPHTAGEKVYSMDRRQELISQYNTQTWNSNDFNYDGDPLQLSTTQPAKFLRGEAL